MTAETTKLSPAGPSRPSSSVSASTASVKRQAGSGDPTTKAELYSWWAYFIGYEPLSAIVLAFLLPLATEMATRGVGHVLGQPKVACPETDSRDKICVLFYISSFPISNMAFTYVTIALSAFIQAIVFVSIGALADYGNLRKSLLAFSTVAGVISTCSILLVYKYSLYMVGAFLVLLINSFSGMALVFYNAYLPLLTQNHPDYLKAVQQEAKELEKLEEASRTPLSSLSAEQCAQAALHRKVLSEATVKVGESLSNWISTVGFMSGYAAALVMLSMCAGFMYLAKRMEWMEPFLAIRISIAGVGIWWGIISVFAIAQLKYRPGLPLPPGTNYVFFSWKKLRKTLSKARQLPHTFRYLVCYFFFSDGFNTLGSAAVIFCKTQIDIGTELIVLCLALTLVSAVLGNFLLLYLQRRFRLPNKSLIVAMLLALALLPVYGAIGLVSQTIGLRQRVEVIPMSIYYGVFVGALQSFSRVLFADLIPEKEEAEFFSLYAVTDKGSSWIGPLAVALIGNVADGRYGLLFLALLLLVPLPLLIFGVDPVQGKTDCIAFNKASAEAATDQA